MIKLSDEERDYIISDMLATRGMRFDIVFAYKKDERTLYPYIKLENRKESSIVFLDYKNNRIEADDVECYLNLTNTCYYKFVMNENVLLMGQFHYDSGKHLLLNTVKIVRSNEQDEEDALINEEMFCSIGFKEIVDLSIMKLTNIKSIKLMTEDELDTYARLMKKRVDMLWL